MPRCLRCGEPFERLAIDQIHCIRCAREVATIIADDTARRRKRFPSKDVTTAVAR